MQILICGNYGAGNMGDELMLMGLLKMLKEIETEICHDQFANGSFKNLEITVMSGSPSETEKLHHVKSVKILPTGLRSILKNFISIKTAGETLETIKAIKNADLVLFGGGELFNEGEPYSLYLWYAHAKIFQWLKKPYIIIGQSFSAFQKNITKKILENVINHAEEIYVRDQESQDLLYILNIQKSIEVTTDLAFMLDENDFLNFQNPDSNDLNNLEKSQEIITILRDYRDIKSQKISQKIDRLNIPCLERSFGKIFTREKINEYFANFSKAELIISMRLHGIILATITKTPFIALSYHPKVQNMAKKLGFESFILDPDFNERALQQKIFEIQDKKEKNKDLKFQLQKALEKEKNMITKQKIFLTKLLKKF